MDLWKGYKSATKVMTSNAKIIYDKFHLSKILNRYIEEQRREYQKEILDEDRKEVKRTIDGFLLKRKRNHSKENSLNLKKFKKEMKHCMNYIY